VKMTKSIDINGVYSTDPQSLSASEKLQWLNRTKMLVYLTCQMIEVLEAQDTSSLTMALASVGRGRGKKGSSSAAEPASFWLPDRKLAVVTVLYRLMHLNLAVLFDPPVVEEDFANCVATALFRLMENPSSALQRSRNLLVSICQLLGTLCSRFGYSLSCRLKIVQSLRHFEHLAAPMAEAVQLFAEDYGCPSMVMEIVRDISQIPSQELSRDTSGTRAYATFLAELATKLPEKIKPCLSLLMLHLDGKI